MNSGDRIGVVGINGTGKSTLLRVLAGREEPEDGERRSPKGVRVSFLEQDLLDQSGPVRDHVPGEWQGEAILDRLGMGAELDTDVSTLSGGQRRRVALAAALVTEADLLVLDEPTNHLDIEGIWWLESHLASFKGGLLVVSHDRRFLDAVTTRMIELDRGKAWVHDEGYASYLEAKVDRASLSARHEQVRQNLARRELAWLRRGAKARSTKAKARVDSATALVEASAEREARSGDLDLAQFGSVRLGKKIIEFHNVGHRYSSEWLFRGLDLTLGGGSRIGIIGTNGTGKSTLLELIAGRLEPAEGEIVRGQTVKIGYYDQTGVELDLNQRVFDVVASDATRPDYVTSALLDRFWFDADAQAAPIGMLSGGERRRLQLLLVLLEQPNVLLLDEPTNDLDLDTLRAMEELLDGWPGAMLVASHDRAFLEQTVDHVIAFDGDGVAAMIAGGYAAWEASRKAATKSQSRSKKAASAKAKNRTPSTLRRLVADAEARVEKASAKAETIHSNLSSTTDHQRLAELGREANAADSALAEAEEQWLKLSAELENLGG